jgi:hypothetical protein
MSTLAGVPFKKKALLRWLESEATPELFCEVLQDESDPRSAQRARWAAENAPAHLLVPALLPKMVQKATTATALAINPYLGTEQIDAALSAIAETARALSDRAAAGDFVSYQQLPGDGVRMWVLLNPLRFRGQDRIPMPSHVVLDDALDSLLLESHVAMDSWTAPWLMTVLETFPLTATQLLRVASTPFEEPMRYLPHLLAQKAATFSLTERFHEILDEEERCDLASELLGLPEMKRSREALAWVAEYASPSEVVDHIEGLAPVLAPEQVARLWNRMEDEPEGQLRLWLALEPARRPALMDEDLAPYLGDEGAEVRLLALRVLGAKRAEENRATPPEQARRARR